MKDPIGTFKSFMAKVTLAVKFNRSRLRATYEIHPFENAQQRGSRITLTGRAWNLA